MKLCVGARAHRTVSKHTQITVSERAHSHRDRPASVSLHKLWSLLTPAHVTGLTRSHSSLNAKSKNEHARTYVACGYTFRT